MSVKMSIQETARRFAINAHHGQIRKNEPEKPLVLHAVEVAKILEEYGADKNVVAAGYLHDVVEDTNYELEYILEHFGPDVADLVRTATEPDKSLSWEERKNHTIEATKTLPLRNKMVICADKISNLESMLNKFGKTGKRDFSAFKRGEEEQCWYYTEVYKSLILNEDENHPMFVRLKDVLDKLFYDKTDSYLEEVIFMEKPEYFNVLKMFHARKNEIKSITKLVKAAKPYVIEFAGTPRTGKTSILKNLEEFFRKGGFKVKVIEEFTTSKYFKEQFKPKMSYLPDWEYHIAIKDAVKAQLEEAVKHDYDVILVDRSINDRQVWNHRRYLKSKIDENIYLEAKEKFSKDSKSLIDFLLVTYADSLTSVKRDYQNSLALEERKFINDANIEEYNFSLMSLHELFSDSVGDYVYIDTSEISKEEVTIKAVNLILTAMRNLYLGSFIQEVNQYVGKAIPKNIEE